MAYKDPKMEARVRHHPKSKTGLWHLKDFLFWPKNEVSSWVKKHLKSCLGVILTDFNPVILKGAFYTGLYRIRRFSEQCGEYCQNIWVL